MNSIAEIQRATAVHFGLTRAELLGRDTARRYSWPRQLGMAIARENGHSLPKIGQHFGRDHTTVLHAVRAVPTREGKTARDAAAIRASLKLYSGVLVGLESKVAAARAIGRFCAVLSSPAKRSGAAGGGSARTLRALTEGAKATRPPSASHFVLGTSPVNGGGKRTSRVARI